jgi:hypothetical protein
MCFPIVAVPLCQNSGKATGLTAEGILFDQSPLKVRLFRAVSPNAPQLYSLKADTPLSDEPTFDTSLPGASALHQINLHRNSMSANGLLMSRLDWRNLWRAIRNLTPWAIRKNFRVGRLQLT